MYFILLIRDYFNSLERIDKITDIGIPSILTIILGGIMLYFKGDYTGIFESSLTFVSVLVGFSITSIAVITSSSNEALDNLKTKKSNLIIGGHVTSMFQMFFTNLAYSVLVGILLIMYSFISMILVKSGIIYFFMYIVSIFSIFHLLMVNINNITFFYMAFFDSNTKNQ